MHIHKPTHVHEQKNAVIFVLFSVEIGITDIKDRQTTTRKTNNKTEIKWNIVETIFFVSVVAIEKK